MKGQTPPHSQTGIPTKAYPTGRYTSSPYQERPETYNSNLVSIPRELVEKLSGTAIAVLTYFASKDPEFQADIESLAWQLRFSEKSVKCAINELIEAGAVRKNEVRKRGGQFARSAFQLGFSNNFYGAHFDRTVKNRHGGLPWEIPEENGQPYKALKAPKKGGFSEDTPFLRAKASTLETHPLGFSEEPPFLKAKASTQETHPLLQGLNRLVEVEIVSSKSSERAETCDPFGDVPVPPSAKKLMLSRHSVDEVALAASRYPDWNGARDPTSAMWYLLHNPDTWVDRLKVIPQETPESPLYEAAPDLSKFDNTLSRFSPSQLDRLQKVLKHPKIARSLAWATVVLASGEKSTDDALKLIFTSLKNPDAWDATLSVLPEEMSDKQIEAMVAESTGLFDGIDLPYAIERIKRMLAHDRKHLVYCIKKTLAYPNRESDKAILDRYLRGDMNTSRKEQREENVEFLRKLIDQKLDGRTWKGVRLEVTSSEVRFVYIGSQKSPTVHSVDDPEMIKKYSSFFENREKPDPKSGADLTKRESGEDLAEREPGFDTENHVSKNEYAALIERGPTKDEPQKPRSISDKKLTETAACLAPSFQDFREGKVQESEKPTDAVVAANEAFFRQIKHMHATPISDTQRILCFGYGVYFELIESIGSYAMMTCIEDPDFIDRVKVHLSHHDQMRRVSAAISA